MNKPETIWRKMDDPPYEGYTGVVLICGLNGKQLPKDEYWTQIATYCDGFWYYLDYDEHTGVLRKVPVHGEIAAYGQYIVPEWHDAL